MEQGTTYTEIPEDITERLDTIISQQSDLLDLSADTLQELREDNLYLKELAGTTSEIYTLNFWFCGLLGMIIGVLFVHLLRK